MPPVRDLRPVDRHEFNWINDDSGTLAPTIADGFYRLNRGAHAVLRIYKTFGLTDRAEELVGRLHDVGPAEPAAALSVVWAVTGEG